MKRPLWVKIDESDFDSLIQDVYDNLNNNEFKTTVNKRVYELKNARKFLLIIGTQKVSEKEANELHSGLIAPDITVLKNMKGKSKNKRYNILNVLINLRSVFTGVYLHNKDVSSELELESEESIVERTKLRRQRSAEQPNEQPYTTDIPDLESEESAAEQRRRNQQGKGLKILTPYQMLSRLPISLAQLKAGNNS